MSDYWFEAADRFEKATDPQVMSDEKALALQNAEREAHETDIKRRGLGALAMTGAVLMGGMVVGSNMAENTGDVATLFGAYSATMIGASLLVHKLVQREIEG